MNFIINTIEGAIHQLRVQVTNEVSLSEFTVYGSAACGCSTYPFEIVEKNDKGNVIKKRRFLVPLWHLFDDEAVKGLEKLLGDGGHNDRDLIAAHRQKLRQKSVHLGGKDRYENADQNEGDGLSGLFFDQARHKQDRHENRYEQYVDQIVHFSAPFLAASIIAKQSPEKTREVTTSRG